VAFGTHLGKGSFADVYRGKWEEKEVALKKFKDEDKFKECGFNEAAIMW